MDATNHPISEIGLPILKVLLPGKYLQGECNCITVIEQLHLGFHLGMAVDHLWHCGERGDATEDLGKARWYLDRLQHQPTLQGQSNSVAKAIGMIDGLISVPESVNRVSVDP